MVKPRHAPGHSKYGPVVYAAPADDSNRVSAQSLFEQYTPSTDRLGRRIPKILAAGLLALAACGGGSGDSAADTASAPDTSASETTPASDPANEAATTTETTTTTVSPEQVELNDLTVQLEDLESVFGEEVEPSLDDAKAGWLEVAANADSATAAASGLGEWEPWVNDRTALLDETAAFDTAVAAAIGDIVLDDSGNPMIDETTGLPVREGGALIEAPDNYSTSTAAINEALASADADTARELLATLGSDIDTLKAMIDAVNKDNDPTPGELADNPELQGTSEVWHSALLNLAAHAERNEFDEAVRAYQAQQQTNNSGNTTGGGTTSGGTSSTSGGSSSTTGGGSTSTTSGGDGGGETFCVTFGPDGSCKLWSNEV